MADVEDDGGLLGKLKGRMKDEGLAPVTETQEFDDDLLIGEQDVATHHEDDGLRDQIKNEVGILDAYNRWAGKGTAKEPRGRTESIKIRCPNPAHVDSNPSAWANTEKNTYFCGACQEGGDVFDIAAYSFGYPVPGYRSDERFGKVKDRIAQELGYRIVKTPGGQQYLERSDSPPPQDDATPPDPDPEDETSAISKFRQKFVKPPEVDLPEGEGAKVISIVPQPGDDDAEPVSPSIDWREMLPSDTFLRKWMEATSKDDLPEEYYFWLGMMSIGLAVNNNMALADNPPVKGNMFICLYGPTGIGKSRATNATLGLLREAFPFDSGDGVFQIPSPGSAESLIDAFAYTIGGEDEEPANLPITGLIRFDELSTLMGRAERQGSAMKPTLMEFYDSYNPVTHKTRGHGLVEAHGHFASCITTTQPKAIRDLLTQTDADAGFVNRWLFATGVGKKPIAFGREDIDYSRSVPLLRKINEWSIEEKLISPRVSSSGIRWGAISMTPPALELWEEFFYDEVVPTKTRDNSALLSRLDLTMKKIIALLAFDRQHMPVELRDVQDAIKLWKYLNQSYDNLSREIGVGVFEDCRHAVTDIVKEHHRRTQKHATARDILRGIGSRFSSSLVKSVLETLVSLGELNEYLMPAEEGKRKAPRYAYVE